MPPPPPSPLREILPQPAEEKKKKKSDRSPDVAEPTTSPKSPRRALPQPIETSSSTSKRATKRAEDGLSRDHVRIITSNIMQPLPQPIGSSTTASKTSKPRRFAPEMVETSRSIGGRSRRNTASDEKGKERTSEPQDHLPPHMKKKRPDLVPGPPENSPIVSTDHVPQVPESKFSSSKLRQRVPRQHSFHIPDLPVIKSTSGTEDGSDLSETPSLTTSPSAESAAAPRSGSKKRKKTYPIARRESEDETSSGYLLSLAATAAEKQLREQAMAAYPNENVHEQVDHYAGDRDSDEDSEAAVHMGRLMREDEEETSSKNTTGRRQRDSAAGWDMAEMRRHQSKLEEQRQTAWAAREMQPELDPSRRPVQQKLAEGGPPTSPKAKKVPSWQEDNEIKPMRKAASPPMAGGSLIFSKCISPQATRMDVHQYPGTRTSAGPNSRGHTGLWTSGPGCSRNSSQSGLWRGVNAASAQPALNFPKSIQSGLQTPGLERSDPFNTASTLSSASTGLTIPTLSSTSASQSPSQKPQPSTSRPSPPFRPSTCPDLTLTKARSQTIPEEYPETFITQVYNYLSLGYPTLARPYDDELSRITRIPVSDLRCQDPPPQRPPPGPHTNLTNINPFSSDFPSRSMGTETNTSAPSARGYIGTPEGIGTDARGATSAREPCKRWEALRLYVWEWGRQQREREGVLEGTGAGAEEELKGVKNADTTGGWGLAARKGSWGW